MPQSKGNENCLTNPRKTVNGKNIRVDNSEAYLKNDDLENGLQMALDAIHIQHRRAMGGHDDDIKAVKEKVRTMHAWQRFAKMNKTKIAFEASLQERKKMSDDTRQDTKSKKDDENDKKPKFHASNTSGFSRVDISDTDDNLDFRKESRAKFHRTRTKSAHPRLHSYKNTATDTNDDGVNGFVKPSLAGRPKSSFVPDSSRSPSTTRRSRSPARRQHHRRPKTTISIRNAIAREFNTPGPTPRLQAKLAGRSFHELKELTDFDDLKSTEHDAKRAAVLEKRVHEHVQDDIRLKERIMSFYTDLEKFKKSNLQVISG